MEVEEIDIVVEVGHYGAHHHAVAGAGIVVEVADILVVREIGLAGGDKDGVDPHHIGGVAEAGDTHLDLGIRRGGRPGAQTGIAEVTVDSGEHEPLVEVNVAHIATMTVGQTAFIEVLRPAPAGREAVVGGGAHVGLGEVERQIHEGAARGEGDDVTVAQVAGTVAQHAHAHLIMGGRQEILEGIGGVGLAAGHGPRGGTRSAVFKGIDNGGTHPVDGGAGTVHHAHGNHGSRAAQVGIAAAHEVHVGATLRVGDTGDGCGVGVTVVVVLVVGLPRLLVPQPLGSAGRHIGACIVVDGQDNILALGVDEGGGEINGVPLLHGEVIGHVVGHLRHAGHRDGAVVRRVGGAVHPDTQGAGDGSGTALVQRGTVQGDTADGVHVEEHIGGIHHLGIAVVVARGHGVHVVVACQGGQLALATHLEGHRQGDHRGGVAVAEGVEINLIAVRGDKVADDMARLAGALHLDNRRGVVEVAQHRQHTRGGIAAGVELPGIGDGVEAGTGLVEVHQGVAAHLGGDDGGAGVALRSLAAEALHPHMVFSVGQEIFYLYGGARDGLLRGGGDVVGGVVAHQVAGDATHGGPRERDRRGAYLLHGHRRRTLAAVEGRDDEFVKVGVVVAVARAEVGSEDQVALSRRQATDGVGAHLIGNPGIARGIGAYEVVG